MWKKLIICAVVLSLTGLLVNCGKFLEGGILDSDPNRTTEVPLLEQLANLQPVLYGFYEGDVGIFALLWMQQLAGVNHQYMAYEIYDVTSDLFEAPWGSAYMEGGMIDQNEVIERAESDGKRIVAGIAKMHKALMMATAAFAFGDMPYTQAAQASTYPAPVYDDQEDVHNAVLALIDDAIADFVAGQTFFDGTYDFSFGGDTDKWIAAARTLKARIYLNWAEVSNGNYALALQEAQQGIGSVDGNWRAIHSEIAGEWNVFYQLKYQQRWYERVGAQLVNMFKDDNDPRLEVFFEPNSQSEYLGSGHGEFLEDVSWFNDQTIGASGWDVDMVTWEENQFIIAECQFQAGSEAAALTTLNETLDGIEARWAAYLGSATIPRYTGLTGTALLEAIMNEKYKALIQNPQVWDDWKRTGYPQLTTFENRPVPRRFIYPDDEQNTNPNFPGRSTIWDRNDNDPGDP